MEREGTRSVDFVVQDTKKEAVEGQKVRGGDRRRLVVGALNVFSQVAVKRLGYSGAAVARYLGVTTSLVNRYASSKEVSNLKQYLKVASPFTFIVCQDYFRQAD